MNNNDKLEHLNTSKKILNEALLQVHNTINAVKQQIELDRVYPKENHVRAILVGVIGIPITGSEHCGWFGKRKIIRFDFDKPITSEGGGFGVNEMLKIRDLGYSFVGFTGNRYVFLEYMG